MCVGVMRDKKTKTEGSTLLGYTGLRGGLEHLTCPKDRDEVQR